MNDRDAIERFGAQRLIKPIGTEPPTEQIVAELRTEPIDAAVAIEPIHGQRPIEPIGVEPPIERPTCAGIWRDAAMERNLFPIVAFDLIENFSADQALARWGHWLGGCQRPFGRQSWGLLLHGDLAAVAVSASTVNATCAGFARQQVVELARLWAHPDHRDLTRAALRLWRKVAPAWAARYWPLQALVSYANAARHRGDIYRFDGWRRAAEVRPSGAGSSWARPRKPGERKTVWVFDLLGPAADAQENHRASGATQLPDLPTHYRAAASEGDGR